MRLLACLIVAPQRGYDEPAILSYAISSFCPTSADGLHSMSENPVTLRPGRARLSTAPDAIGSLVNATTIGIERVNFVRIGMTRSPTITMTSGFSSTRFEASALTKSMLLVDQRSSN